MDIQSPRTARSRLSRSTRTAAAATAVLSLAAAVHRHTIITSVSVAVLVVFSAMVALVLQRRLTRWTPVVNFLVLSGLIVPLAVVPTIWVLPAR